MREKAGEKKREVEIRSEREKERSKRIKQSGDIGVPLEGEF